MSATPRPWRAHPMYPRLVIGSDVSDSAAEGNDFHAPIEANSAEDRDHALRAVNVFDALLAVAQRAADFQQRERVNAKTLRGSRISVRGVETEEQALQAARAAQVALEEAVGALDAHSPGWREWETETP